MHLKSMFAIVSLLEGLNCQSVPLIQQITENKYFQEACFVLFVLLLVYSFFTGKSQNRAICKQFLSQNMEFFLKNFSYTGIKHTSTEALVYSPDIALNDNLILEEESPNSFRVFFTGRNNVKFAILNVSLLRRHDFLLSNFYSLVFPEKDNVTIELALEESGISKGLIYLLKLKNIKKTIEDFEDLRTLCRKFKSEYLTHPNFSIFSENAEIVEIFFDKSFSEILNKNGDLVESIEISDCVVNEFNKGANAKITLNFGKRNDADYKRAGEIIAGFFQAIDRIAAFIPSKKLGEELSENRKRFATLKDKQKKIESGETGNSWEERYAKLGPAEKKKMEEKEARKAKAKNKMIKMVKS